KLDKFICEYSICAISSRFYNSRFHIIYTYLFRYSTQLLEYPCHTIEKTFLIFSRQWNSKGTVTKRQCQYQTMNIDIFTVFHCFHKTKVKLCFGGWMGEPFIVFITLLIFCLISTVIPFLHEVTDGSVRP